MGKLCTTSLCLRRPAMTSHLAKNWKCLSKGSGRPLRVREVSHAVLVPQKAFWRLLRGIEMENWKCISEGSSKPFEVQGGRVRPPSTSEHAQKQLEDTSGYIWRFSDSSICSFWYPWGWGGVWEYIIHRY